MYTHSRKTRTSLICVLLSSIAIIANAIADDAVEIELQDLRSAIPLMQFSANESTLSQKFSEAYSFCDQLLENRTKPRFVAAVFCSQLDQLLGIKTPVEWQKQIENLFSRPVRKDIGIEKSKLRARVLKGKVLGLSKKLTWPDTSELVFDSMLIDLETDREIYLIGFRKYNLSDLVVYERSTGKLIRSIAFFGSGEPGGNPIPIDIEKEDFVDMIASADKSTVYIFQIRAGSVVISSLLTNNTVSQLLFHSGDVVRKSTKRGPKADFP